MTDLEAGDELTADRLREMLADEFADEREERDTRKEREAAREELREEYPELSGLSFDPDKAHSVLAEAAETGERKAVATGGDRCNDPSEECSHDIITAYATPEGDVERERDHTY